MDWLRRRFRPATPAEPPAPVPPAVSHLAAARGALHRADAREALRQIALGIEADPAYTPLYKLVATAYALLPTGQNEWRLFAALAERGDDPQAFLNLGHYFIGTPNHRTAIPLLRRALSLAPGDVKVVCELAIALLGEFQPHEARAALLAVDLGDDPDAVILLHHSRLLCGDTGGIQQFVVRQRPPLDDELASTPEGPAREEIQKSLDRLDQLEESLRRLTTIPQPERNLRHWHFIQYGAVILHVVSPVAPVENRDMRGRYAGVAPTVEDIERIAARLIRLLAALDRTPQTVIALPDSDSLRVAETVAKAAGVPMEALPSPLANRSSQQMMEAFDRERDLLALTGSLVVAADNRRLDAYPAFRQVRPEQTVFAFSHHWLAASSLTPDVSGFMCQTCRFPWTAPVNTPAEPGPRARFSDPDPPQRPTPPRRVPTPTPADVPEDFSDFEPTAAFYQQRAALIKGVPEAGPHRSPFLRDSPVPGTYDA